MRTKTFILTAGLGAVLGSIPLFAYPAGDAIRLKSIAEIEKNIVDQSGNKIIKRVPVERAIPATEVIYTTTFENTSAKTFGNVVIDNPIPNNSAYRADSAFGKGFDIQFSTDTGRKYAQASQLTVKGSDGKQRLAMPNEYTNIRWTHKGPLPAGGAGEVGFRAVVN
jgi:uncharacterized repeat protein (TIGR01451 family)